MGLLSGLMGNASSVDLEATKEEFKDVLLESEELQLVFKLIRDMFLFTDFRLILVDKQGIRGKKVEYLTIPYKSITQFSVETAGSFDGDAELKIWVSGAEKPIEKDFKKGTDIISMQKTIAQCIQGAS